MDERAKPENFETTHCSFGYRWTLDRKVALLFPFRVTLTAEVQYLASPLAIFGEKSDINVSFFSPEFHHSSILIFMSKVVSSEREVGKIWGTAVTEIWKPLKYKHFLKFSGFGYCLFQAQAVVPICWTARCCGRQTAIWLFTAFRPQGSQLSYLLLPCFSFFLFLCFFLLYSNEL